MEHSRNILAGTSTDERVSPSTLPAAGDAGAAPSEDPAFATEAEARAYWDGVTHGLQSAIGETRRDDDQPCAPRDRRHETAEVLDPCHRGLRHDGWLPEKKARFLLVLVAGGIVADACRAVGMSVASAYALRNRRSGRAFGRMWDSILIHRARCRLADNNLSRAMNGCIDQIVKDGIVVAERRRFDNRLSMAVLTRLDRLAESKTGEEAELLRALSEDFDDYLELVETGGDEDEFVEAHRPEPEPEPKPADRERPSYVRDELDHIAAAAGVCPWRHVTPPEIPIADLDPDRMDDWGLEGWIRAIRSHYLDWLELYRDSGEPRPDGSDCPGIYDRVRREIMAAIASKRAGSKTPPPTLEDEEEGGEWQASTSSTSPAETPSRGPAVRAGGEEI